MKNTILLLLCLMVASQSIAQNPSIISTVNRGEANFNPLLEPFYHGVASGDPLSDAVIIWTRITLDDISGNVDVNWKICTDTELNNIVQAGVFSTNEDRDYTVKIDVQGLDPNTTYYYGFSYDGMSSMTGRTRTAPVGDMERLRFGVVTCSNFGQGYFSAYSRLADRNDLHAVIHMGDYYYEYGTSTNAIPGREDLCPTNEILTLSDYRIRHGFYKLDFDLRRIHQQHPMIITWDDHEVANNAWLDGAENHNAGEGDYQERKSAAIQAYMEWLPIREQENDNQRVYRKFSYSDLADIIMLDTRHEGRDEQQALEDSIIWTVEDRTILGQEQYEWFLNELETSTAQWKVVGSQVLFTPVSTLGALDNMDAWDGYPAERNRVVNFIDSMEIDNIVVITGDIHIALAGDVALDPFEEYDPITGSGYDPENGDGACAVEMITPSISSNNLDDTDVDLPIPISAVPAFALSINPHGKFLNVVDHGYFILDLDNERAQGDWYWLDSKLTPNSGEYQEHTWYTLDGENFLRIDSIAATDIVPAPDPAPGEPTVSIEELKENSGFTILSAFPNPTKDIHLLNYALEKTQQVKIDLLDSSGKFIKTLKEEKQVSGVYTLQMNVEKLPAANYILQIYIGNQLKSYKVSKL